MKTAVRLISFVPLAKMLASLVALWAPAPGAHANAAHLYECLKGLAFNNHKLRLFDCEGANIIIAYLLYSACRMGDQMISASV